MLERLLGLLQLLLIFEGIQMGQDPHHFGEAMHLCDHKAAAVAVPFLFTNLRPLHVQSSATAYIRLQM